MTAGRIDPRILFMQRVLDASAPAYKLAGLLCWRYGSRDGAIFPSQEKLAKDLGVTDRHIRRILKELVPFGLRVDTRPGPRTGKSMSFYSFDGPINPDLDVRNRGGNVYGSVETLRVTSREFRTFETRDPDIHVQNSGHTCPPNQKDDPKELTLKGAVAEATRPDEDQNDDEERYGVLASSLSAQVYRDRKQGRVSRARSDATKKEIRRVETLIANGAIEYLEGIRRLEIIQIARNLEKTLPSQQRPYQAARNGSPEFLATAASPDPAPPPKRPVRSPEANVIPLAGPPTVPKPPAPSRPRRRKPNAADQQDRDIRKSAVWRDRLAGRVATDEEAERLVRLTHKPESVRRI